jgi:thymidylate synthase ThyX
MFTHETVGNPECYFRKTTSESCRVLIPELDITGFNTQNYAVMAAMFSRSNEGVEIIAGKLTADKAGSFMEKTYIGYGHESIGDMVDVKLFIEGVPMYVAAWLEHHSLFRGQESSTRYIDFSQTGCAFDADREVFNTQISLYKDYFETVKNRLLYSNADTLSNLTDSESKTHTTAINARAFDIARGLIPLASLTNVAWFGNIRTIKAHLSYMSSKEWAKPYVDTIWTALKQAFPQSMERDIVNVRPITPYPSPKYDIVFEGLLDIGSWRDIHRHRVGYQSWIEDEIFLWENIKFNTWYKRHYLKDGLDIDKAIKPYLDKPCLNTALLGFNTSFTYKMTREQLGYFSKLRSSPTVHPTLRNLVQNTMNNRYSHLNEYEDVNKFSDYNDLNSYVVSRGLDVIHVKGN